MVRRIVIFSLAAIFVVSLSGCATGRKQKDLEIQGLRNQISALETQVQSKDEEINSLRESLSKQQSEKQVSEVATTKPVGKKRIIGEVKSRPTVKHIQIALENAGYNPGTIDGRMGKQTREALKAFQRANNLHADGKAGKETWNLLRDYLYKKASVK
jgi:peptidoglycan hydrolase-like protein with peptidoglycan-binding domain